MIQQEYKDFKVFDALEVLLNLLNETKALVGFQAYEEREFSDYLDRARNNLLK